MSKQPSVSPSSRIPIAPPSPIAAHERLPNDLQLLTRARIQWLFGDWESLARLDLSSIQEHPERAELILLAIVGKQYVGDTNASKTFLDTALEWGCEKREIAKILAAGVESRLGRAHILSGNLRRAVKHLAASVDAQVPFETVPSIVKVHLDRILEQFTRDGRLSADSSLTLNAHARLSLHDVEALLSDRPSERPILRVMHHLSSTGGTLFAKCIAAQPDVVLLNELDPFSPLEDPPRLTDKPRFTPRDIISLLHQSGFEASNQLIGTLSLSGVETIDGYLRASGKRLVIREHSHGAYLYGSSLRNDQAFRHFAAHKFALKSIVTVRNPIDSYLSAKASNFLHFSPTTFDEYCSRCIRFVTDYRDCQIFRYEDLIADSSAVMSAICRELQLDFDATFSERLAQFRFSGDSGRASAHIEPKARRDYDAQFVGDVNSSIHYPKLCQLIGYQVETL